MNDYLPTDAGTQTKEPEDKFFLTEEEKKNRWDKLQDTELDGLLETDDNTPL